MGFQLVRSCIAGWELGILNVKYIDVIASPFSIYLINVGGAEQCGGS